MERNLDFDTIVDRKNTDCLKYDFAVRRGLPEDVLPLWVADMDFKTSSYIIDELKKVCEHGIFGYTETQTEYFNAIAGWMKNQHNWKVQEEWLIKTPGVVFALAMAVKAFTQKGDTVILQLPVYYPFMEVIRNNERKVVSSDLVLGNDNRYHIDFSDFENKIIQNNVKLFFLCSPHNPVGRVWSKEELLRLGEICLRHKVIVVSDEIHNDFIFEGQHNVFTSLNEELANVTITCTSPSKTFNLAGTLISNIFISNPELRKKFKKQVNVAGISQLSVFGIKACQTAYQHGLEWFTSVKKYIKANIDFIEEFTQKNLSGVKMIHHEGTYLVWLDFRGTGLNVQELEDLIINKAKLWLDSGKIFGTSGNGFQRINAACPRKTLEEAMKRIQKALQ
ncbi:MalY/PatB family protein [Treponema succinifaciens]|uniref:MalY/PatB family protein n=1 Tax=Treponema succinifaciens TaxID=167 RepID=UPI003FCD6D34